MELSYIICIPTMKNYASLFVKYIYLLLEKITVEKYSNYFID